MSERKLARIVSADIEDVYNGMLGLCVHFEYEDGMHQNLSGYVIEAAFVVRFMVAVGVSRLRDAAGRSCWVTCTHSSIEAIEPLHKKDGRPFVIAEWQAWLKERFPEGISWRELETGERPS